MLCPSCNASNRDDAKFCKHCRHQLHAEPVPVSALAAADTQAAEAPSTPAIANQVAEPTDVGPEEIDDLSMAPTVIFTPEQLRAYHSRFQQQEADPRGENQAATEIADMPTVFMSSPVTNDEPIPIPPPPPSEGSAPRSEAPVSSGDDVGQGAVWSPAEEATGVRASSTPTTQTKAREEASTRAPTVDPATSHEGEGGDDVGQGAVWSPAEEVSNRIPTTEVTNHVTQTPSGEPNQAQPASDFSALAVGTTVAGRYSVTQPISASEQENVYQVTDHQGYQRCWNCASEQNAQGDEFCISCGAELLNASYVMHEYSTTPSTAVDTRILQGTIVNTFVEHERTYVIEQPQAPQNAFPNGVHLLAASLSDAGDIRRSEPNEDSTLVLLLQRLHESISVPSGIFIVADGLGGHDNGQLASRMTIATIAERILRELLTAPLSAEKTAQAVEPLSEDALVALLQSAVEEANTLICQMNERDKTDMGSTITGFMIVKDHAYIFNVGDSRTYMLRAGQLYKLTNDHSLVEQLVAGGLIEPDEVYTHPQRSQIFRSLGDKLNVQIDIFKQQLHSGDIILSCSDGLWEMVHNPQIEGILHAATDPQLTCNQLIEAANTNGGEDNVSAVIVFIR